MVERYRSLIGALALLALGACGATEPVPPTLGADATAAIGGAAIAPVAAKPVGDPAAEAAARDARRDAWADHFPSVADGAILVSIPDRRLQFWKADGSYHEFTVAVPRSRELSRTGVTQVVRKRRNPDWTPTPDMLAEDPTLAYVPPGPTNPLGTRALYLGWQYYAIHGTNRPSSIGRKATAGCFRMGRKDVEFLFQHAPVGTPVKVI